MKTLAYTIIAAGLMMLVVAVVSRVTMIPIGLVRGGIEAEALLDFANTCFLLSIILILLNKKEPA